MLKQNHIIEYNEFGPYTGSGYNYSQKWVDIKTKLDLESHLYKEKVYIAGPMTGLKDDNRKAFDEAVEFLKNLEVIETIINPFDIGENLKLNPKRHMGTAPLSIADYIKADIQELIQCQVIAILPGWEDSKNATLERQIARCTGMVVYYIGNDKLT